MKTRYTFFVYSYWTNRKQGKGNLTVKSNGFPTMDEVKISAFQMLEKRSVVPLENAEIVIENWIEMSKEDYEDWNNKSTPTEGNEYENPHTTSQQGRI